jgi:choice-of-anchor B domain-containing protein
LSSQLPAEVSKAKRRISIMNRFRLAFRTLVSRSRFQRGRRNGRKNRSGWLASHIERLEDRRLLTGTIGGVLWQDSNADGIFDASEVPFENGTVYLDENRNGQLDGGEVSETTNANGEYTFTARPAGEYVVAIEVPSGWVETSPILAVVPPDDGSDPDGFHVELLSHVPLATFTDGSARANDITSYVSPLGEEYAVIGLEKSVAFVRVTDPVNPVVVAVMAGLDEGGGNLIAARDHDDSPQKEGSIWRDMKVYDQYAFAVTEAESGSGVQVFDLSQIDADFVTDITPLTQIGPDTSHNIAVNPESGFLYLMGSSNTYGFGSNGGIVAVDVNNPSSPLANAEWTWDTRYIHDAVVVTYSSGDYAGREILYGFGESSGVYVIDVTDKANMVTIGFTDYPNIRYSHSGSLSQDLKYLFVNDELDEIHDPDITTTATHILNVEDPSTPYYVATFTNGVAASDHNSFVRDNFLYLASYRAGLRVYDVTDPMIIVERGYYDTIASSDTGLDGAWGVDANLPSGIVLISDVSGGLFVMDTSHATVPQGAYLVDVADGQTVLNIDFGILPSLAVTVDALTTTDTTPELTGTVNDPTAIVAVTVAGNLYAATNNGNDTWMLADNTISLPLARGTYDVLVTATTTSSVASDTTFDELEIGSASAITTNLDVDANGEATTLTDGVMIVRYLFGVTGTQLTDGALGTGALRTDPNEIIAFLEPGLTTMLDVDANGEAGALTDGVLIVRYLFGVTGTQLTDGAMGTGAVRTDPVEIIAFLDGFLPAAASASLVVTTQDTLIANHYEPVVSRFETPSPSRYFDEMNVWFPADSGTFGDHPSVTFERSLNRRDELNWTLDTRNETSTHRLLRNWPRTTFLEPAPAILDSLDGDSPSSLEFELDEVFADLDQLFADKWEM